MSIRLSHPAPAASLTAHFGYRPAFIENGIRIPAMLHNGTDFGAPAGTPILAAHAGRVTYVGWDQAGGGWMVKIGAAFGSTLYLHMRERSPFVNPGDEVKAGQPIGRVGMTGTATGNHLHFMLRLNGMDINPYPYLTSNPAHQGDDMTPEQDAMLRAVYHTLTPGESGKKTQGEANALLYGIKSGVDKLVDSITSGKAGVRNAGVLVGALAKIQATLDAFPKK